MTAKHLGRLSVLSHGSRTGGARCAKSRDVGQVDRLVGRLPAHTHSTALLEVPDQFMVFPFGLNTAPRVFSEVMKILKKWGRRVGIMLFQYLDD